MQCCGIKRNSKIGLRRDSSCAPQGAQQKEKGPLLRERLHVIIISGKTNGRFITRLKGRAYDSIRFGYGLFFGCGAYAY